MKRIVGSRLAIAAILLGIAGPLSAADPPTPLRTVKVLATGGTIAGSGSSGGPFYRPGAIAIADVLRSVPGLATVANVTAEQVANVGSADIDEAIWRRLIGRVEAALADPAVAGVVVTHGTDTLEETAFLLSLVVGSPKPVVVVGAMRPSTALSADGPHNLLDAVRVAASDQARGRGTLVVMNDSIFDPASVTKIDFRRVDAFAAPIGGPVGDMLTNTPRFFRPAAARQPAFALSSTPLPRVAISYAYAGYAPRDVDTAARDVDGLVIAGAGSGGVSIPAQKRLDALIAKGLPVVRSARQGAGDVWSAARLGLAAPASPRIIAGRELTPAKARILLMLALQTPRSMQELQQIFDRHGVAGR